MLGGLQNDLGRKWRIIGIVFAVLVLLLAFLFFYEPSSPDGVYYWPELACGHGVWIFKNGKIYDQCVGDDAPSEVGSYMKSDNKWISFPQNGKGQNGIFIKPTIFGIKMYGLSSKNSCNFYFRDQFSWLYDCKLWLQRRF